MDRERHKRNYDLHSWTGITLGLIVFVVAFTGCFALFGEELQTWEDPTLRLETPSEPVDISEHFNKWIAEVTSEGEGGFSSLYLPNEERPYYAAYSFVGNESDEIRWNASTGEEIPHRAHGLTVWLLDIHRDFMWPDFLGGRTLGRGLVGIAGIILMLAILTGVIAHTKIREEAYSMRLKRSQRLKWQDSHKVVGLWGLPFFIMIAFTGAILGIVSLLSLIVAAIAFKGDVEALEHAVFGDHHAEPTGQQVQMMSLDELRKMRHPESGFAPDFITMDHYGDEAAILNVFFHADTELLLSETISFKGATGERFTNGQLEVISPASRVTGAMAPLHYGTYGGIWLKFLYFILGMGLAVVTALGSMMWIERRKHGNEGGKSETFYNRLGYFNTGVIMGLPVATLALFYLDKLYVGAEAGRLAATGWTYFAVWATGLIYAFIRRNDYQTTRELMMLTGCLAVGVPILNGFVTGDWFVSELLEGAPLHAWVDLVILLAGAATILISTVSPKARKQAHRNQRRTGQAGVVEAAAE